MITTGSFFGKYLITLNPNWGPSNEQNRANWIEFKEEKRRLREVDIKRHNLSWSKQKWWELTGNFNDFVFIPSNCT